MVNKYESNRGETATRGAVGNVSVLHGSYGRIVFVSDIRGNVRLLNQIASETKARAIVHTGDFGFFASDSLPRLSDRVLRHVVQYSPLISPKLRSLLLDTEGSALRQGFVSNAEAILSEFPQLLDQSITLHVPVYTVHGACEDIQVLERVRSGEYQIPNLHLIDEATTHALDVGGLRLRLLGLGGAVVMHKLFDHGVGQNNLAGAQGAMWTTILQIGELLETADHVYDPSEVRLFITHGAPGRDALLTQVAHALRTDYSVSAALHLRQVTAFNEFGVNPSLDLFREKILHSHSQFEEVWDAVKTQVNQVIDPSQRSLLDRALQVVLQVPQPITPGGRDESTWKNTWYYNLPDAPFGSLLFDIHQARISVETRSQGTSFASRLHSKPGNSVRANVALPRLPDGTTRPSGPASIPKIPVSSNHTLSESSENVLFLGHMGGAFPISEADVRAYFGEHADGVVRVQFFPAERGGRRDKEEGRLRTFVHVVFETEAKAKEALACRGRTIKNTSVVPTLEPLTRKAPHERRDRKDRTERQTGPPSADSTEANEPRESSQGRERSEAPNPTADRRPVPLPENSAEPSQRQRNAHARSGRKSRNTAGSKDTKKPREAPVRAADPSTEKPAMSSGVDTKPNDS
ncbi:hypothetical protein MPSI1_001401 [Malassezia psittaci]|uniref:DUF2433 domain-containing protein n=1 Tax=Malassezia psittaci TaxID=1821823 RepID=A0AAF0F8R7_9BASI|nr:hypothetical protein MPSI1_001401 [Malassezia psittaci]